MELVFLGLSITSSWGNGHATTYRGLVRGLVHAGHSVLFLERDRPWYAENRDLPVPPFGRTVLYQSVEELRDTQGKAIRNADVVVVGSYVPDGLEIGRWVLDVTRGTAAFYDIDTPVTLAQVERQECPYVNAELLARYPLYLSFTGGPLLERAARKYALRMARALYCSADPHTHRPQPQGPKWDLGYLGTHSPDRMPALERLLLSVAQHTPDASFVVAGSMYPKGLSWPSNVERIEHLSPGAHAGFYGAQRFTLNVTRREMVRAGYSPSVRLFEAAACGTPVVTDAWEGLERFFVPDREIFVADSTADVLRCLGTVSDEERRAVGERARTRVLAEHTADHRAVSFIQFVEDARAEAWKRRTATS